MLARAGPATSVPLGPYFSPQRFKGYRWSDGRLPSKAARKYS